MKARDGPKAMAGLLGVLAVLMLLRVGVGRIAANSVGPVMGATINGDFETLKRLAEAGAGLNAQVPMRFDWTPLMSAIYFERTDIIAYLLDRKVDVTRRDRSGNTALMWAITVGDTNTGALMMEKARAGLDQENWPNIRSLIRVSSHSNEWHGLLKEFLTSDREPVKQP